MLKARKRKREKKR